jgi:Tol biopolymer transport system component
MVRLILVFICVFPALTSAQEWEFGVAEKLSDNINSECDDVMPILSNDGKSLYFTRSFCEQNRGGKYTGTDIWMSTLDPLRGRWEKAVNPDVLNDRSNSVAVGVGEQGDMLFYLRTSSARRPEGVYSITRQGGAWSRPKLLSVPGLEPDEYFSVHVTPDQMVMIISMNGPDSRGREDLYISVKNDRGEWTKPRNMGSTINTTGFEMSPFLSANKRRLYFTSSGHAGQGNGDIFYSDRLYDSWEIWSAPRNLGEQVNSKFLDAYFSIYGDTVAYFASNRFKQMDIFKVSVFEKKSLFDVDRRNYLTDEEIQRIAGVTVQPLLYFDAGVSELNDYQKQNLVRIKNGLLNQKEVKFNIIAMKPAEKPLETYQARLLNILDFFKQAGIEGNRIIFSTEQSESTIQSKEMVRIRFYR